MRSSKGNRSHGPLSSKAGRCTIAFLVLFLASWTLDAKSAAMESSHDSELVQRRDKKRESPFISHSGWLVEFEKAKSRATDRNQLVLAYFTRSYEP